MRIGIVTLPFHNNYGGYLQAYALKKTLLLRGHDVYFVSNKKLYGGGLRIIARTVLKIFSILKGLDRNEMKDGNAFAIFKNHYLTPFIDKSNKKELSKIDIFITGSDQVWRNWGFKDKYFFFLDFTRTLKCKRIAYSVSLGVNRWLYDEEETSYIKKLTSDFHQITVRENDAIDILKERLNIKPCRLCDPTLLLSKKEYISFLNIQSNNNFGISTYILDNDNKKSEIVSFIELQKKQRAEYLFCGGQNKGKMCIEKWLKKIMCSGFLITDSFHGTMFAINFNIPFVTLANEKRGQSRLISVLKTYNLESRMISSVKECEEVLQSNIEWDAINAIIENERKNAFAFLDNL